MNRIEKHLPAANGVALQVHGGGDFSEQFVCYRNIRVKRLDAGGKASLLATPYDSRIPRLHPMKTLSPILKRFISLIACFCLTGPLSAADKKIVLIAGTPSHGPGEHEFNAGVLLLKKCLDGVSGVKAETHLNGWPNEGASAFEDADAIVIFCDGGGGHMVRGSHLPEIDACMKKGVGLAFIHYAVEIPKEKGGQEFLAWIGGYFETFWSVNPFWDAEFKTLPKHPITSGVKPFHINDEWYFHMRFAEGMKNVTPILSAVPPESTMSRKDGPHEDNPAVREAVAKGEAQHVAWAFERPDGGRGFGFTGAHFHKNWGNEDFRKIVLNAIVWIAKMDVPASGVSSTVTEEDLQQNLDPKPPKKPKPATQQAPDAAPPGAAGTK